MAHDQNNRTKFVHSPSGLRWQNLSGPSTAIAQQAYASDPKYKKYTQQVEKCLNSFDNVHEWADCISFLKQLLKVRLTQWFIHISEWW